MNNDREKQKYIILLFHVLRAHVAHQFVAINSLNCMRHTVRMCACCEIRYATHAAPVANRRALTTHNFIRFFFILSFEIPNSTSFCAIVDEPTQFEWHLHCALDSCYFN